MTNSFEIANKLLNRIVLPELGDHAPVLNDKLPINPVPGTEVIITKDVKYALDALSDVTNDLTEEITFILFGHVEGQKVLFDEVRAQRSAESSSVSAEASNWVNDEVIDFINHASKDGSRIVAWGHTHPRIGGYYTNFSLGDIKGLTHFRNGTTVFKEEKMYACAVLLTGGNYNFLLFDGNDYYRFDKVFYIDEFNNKIKLPCYGPDVNSLQNFNNRNR